jgi:hypothetical protein
MFACRSHLRRVEPRGQHRVEDVAALFLVERAEQDNEHDQKPSEILDLPQAISEPFTGFAPRQPAVPFLSSRTNGSLDLA